MQLIVEVLGAPQPDVELESLRRTLRADPDLRSATVTSRPARPVVEGAMSAVTDGLVVVFGAGGIGVALVQSATTWLAGRRAGVRLRITQGERTVEVDVSRARRLEDVLALLRTLDALPAAETDGSAVTDASGPRDRG
ncbi:hypothetical protein [Streptomyces sp. UNOB3_S3]|uniref:effector-associated constant component EACC1 n=1 Tax=Streptomyces sp. UNOB3_S3 TaxID=2871682 RepID=UPI001E40D0BE|nr:hypothetical protein [Streptomyces sp. UNOB3_S3]MCC3777901.1 hypothetical protein [Streptomyces sp. UNOB3_S3]